MYGSMETFYFYADGKTISISNQNFFKHIFLFIEGIYDDPDCKIGTTHSVLIGIKSLKIYFEFTNLIFFKLVMERKMA